MTSAAYPSEVFKILGDTKKNSTYKGGAMLWSHQVSPYEAQWNQDNVFFPSQFQLKSFLLRDLTQFIYAPTWKVTAVEYVSSSMPGEGKVGTSLK